MIRVRETDLKSIKRSTGFPDTYFVSKYGFSPYKGCQHGCVYCDGRAERYYVEGVFDQDIEVRVNTPFLLDTELGKVREQGIVGIGSGVSDAYQPLEAEYKIMPKLIDVLIKKRMPAYVMTKSALALRDLEKWKVLNDKCGVTLYVSLTTLTDSIAQVFEPRASLPRERLNLIQQFKQAGIGVVVLAMPLLPEITDTDENVGALFHILKENGVDAVMPGGLTLRPGQQKDFFMDALRKRYPELCSLYEKIYREERASGVPTRQYQHQGRVRLEKLRKQEGLIDYLPHSLYADRLQLYDEIYVLLTHMMGLYQNRGVNTSALKAAYKNYSRWLELEKKQFSKQRTLTGDDLDSKLLFMLQSGTFSQLINNDKLHAFLSDVILERKVLNYHTLKLE